MTNTLRIVLLLAAFITIVWILRKIKKSRVKMEDAVFWFCFAVMMALLAGFPQISFWLAEKLGIQSPANCVFLLIVAALVEKIFTLSIKASQLEDKFAILTAETALRCKDLEIQNVLEKKSCK